jgi:hypothetical protein
MMSELDKLNILKRQKQLKEKHLNLSIEQSLLNRNFQNLESLTQQLEPSKVLVTDSLPFKSTVPIDTVNLFITSLSNHYIIHL